MSQADIPGRRVRDARDQADSRASQEEVWLQGGGVRRWGESWEPWRVPAEVGRGLTCLYRVPCLCEHCRKERGGC